MPGRPGRQGARIVVVGCGFVGSTFAYTVLLRGLADELVLIDVNRAKAEGDAMDLRHGVPFAHPVSVWAGDYGDCRTASLVVLAAGVAQRPGESRRDLLQRNLAVFREVIDRIREHMTEELILLVATNPVDVLTYAAWRFSGLPWQRVVGSGTILDTARFRSLLGERLGVDPRSVHGYVVGEHGDSELAAWSRTHVAGLPLDTFDPTFTEAEREAVFTQVRRAAYDIIERKGATYYAIALGLARIVEAILHDQRSVLTVSTLLQGYHGVSDVCLGVPAVVGRGGVERIIDLKLAPEEESRFQESGRLLREIIREAGL